MTFRALLTTRAADGVTTEPVDMPDDALGPGEVDVAVEWSGINYKDALAVTGEGRIMRRFPLIGGIDLAGTVTASTEHAIRPGERVLVCGHELSQSHHGGFAERARVPADWIVPVPARFTTRQAMQIGTAGYTAALSVLALERAGLTPDRGDVVVTGANGGVGSFAVALLAARGFRVVASTGRTAESAHLRGLGAADVIDRGELSEPGKAFASARWAGAVDVVGSHTLANLLAQTSYGGVVTSCGLAQGSDLVTSVFPFILRGVTLAGIDSVHASRAHRLAAWRLLADQLGDDVLAAVDAGTVPLAGVLDASRAVLRGEVRGRLVVDVLAESR